LAKALDRVIPLAVPVRVRDDVKKQDGRWVSGDGSEYIGMVT
jgi:hypothetical protein